MLELSCRIMPRALVATGGKAAMPGYDETTYAAPSPQLLLALRGADLIRKALA